MAARTFADWLRTAMTRGGYSLDGPRAGGMKQLAEDAGIGDQGQLTRYLSGERVPSAQTVERLATALKADLDEALLAAGHLSTRPQRHRRGTSTPMAYQVDTSGLSEDEVSELNRLADLIRRTKGGRE